MMMADSNNTGYDVERVREAMPMAEVCGREGVVFRKSGAHLSALCPFHEERSPSFSIQLSVPDRAHCFGCGWSGDVFDFWQKRRGVGFKESLLQLAGLAGIAPLDEGVAFKRKSVAKVEVLRGDDKVRVKPEVPLLLVPSDDELAGLAVLRGLSIEGLRVAVGLGRLWVVRWPQSNKRGPWWTFPDAKLSWVVTDEHRWVVQYRRMDGEAFSLGSEGKGIKAWTKGSPSWPLGAAEIGDRYKVLLVEGGADMLAAFHFLWGFNLLHEVAVVCMLGSSNRICKEALPFFDGKRVRIMMDADEMKGVGAKRKAAGAEAALKWQIQLSAAGAVVETFSLYGLLTAVGERVEDLNDLALCGADVVGSGEISDAFFDFNF